MIDSNSSSGPHFIPVSLNIGVDMLGDINLDGTFNIQDIIMLLGFILGNLELSEYQIQLSDINQDLEVNVLDVVTLVNAILSGE